MDSEYERKRRMHTAMAIETRGKIKEIKIQTDEDFIENNLIDLPFIYYYKTDNAAPITNILYEWVDSKNTKKSIEVRSTKLGIPKAYDYDVLLALFRIYIRNNLRDKIDLNTREMTDAGIEKLIQNNEIQFNYSELCKELGYTTSDEEYIFFN